MYISKIEAGILVMIGLFNTFLILLALWTLWT